jgi:hypothetical protein
LRWRKERVRKRKKMKRKEEKEEKGTDWGVRDEEDILKRPPTTTNIIAAQWTAPHFLLDADIYITHPSTHLRWPQPSLLPRFYASTHPCMHARLLSLLPFV